MTDVPVNREPGSDPRRECLACGAHTTIDACEVCGSVDLGPPQQRFGAPHPSELPAARFLYGPARTGRPS